MTSYLAPPNNSLALAGCILGGIASGIAFLVGLSPLSLTPLTVLALLFFTSLPGLLAIIFGFVGISTANRLGGKRRTLAIWAVVLGFIPLAAFLLGQFTGAAIFGWY